MRTITSRVVAGLVLAAAGTATAAAQDPAVRRSDSTVMVDGTVALASLESLADGHLLRMAGFLEVLASGEGRTADWPRIRGRLAGIANHNVAAVLWFARPDGRYWTAAEGREAGDLSDRAYWPRLMAGEPVTGSLVVSRSTGRSVAIVAVPVRGEDGAVIGALGASIHLDSLSLRLAHEMRLPDDVVFYAIDSVPLGALNRDPGLIFTEPLELGPDLARAIREMLAREEGVVTYRFRNSVRTVRFRKSPVTGWWYALGVVRPE
jgi:hypothetical protein